MYLDYLNYWWRLICYLLIIGKWSSNLFDLHLILQLQRKLSLEDQMRHRHCMFSKPVDVRLEKKNHVISIHSFQPCRISFDTMSVRNLLDHCFHINRELSRKHSKTSISMNDAKTSLITIPISINDAKASLITITKGRRRSPYGSDNISLETQPNH